MGKNWKDKKKKKRIVQVNPQEEQSMSLDKMP